MINKNELMEIERRRAYRECENDKREDKKKKLGLGAHITIYLHLYTKNTIFSFYERVNS